MTDLRDLPLVCPCPERSELEATAGGLCCRVETCVHSEAENAFARIGDAVVLISEARCDTLCDPKNIRSYVPRKSSFDTWLKARLALEGSQTSQNIVKFVELVKARNPRPRVLVIGSGEKGGGTDALWNDPDISIHGVDIYKSPSVDVVCDAHYLPLASDAYDGILIQAVLEHVVEPQRVVSEMTRVLADGGIVYAETPFMQQVHEGAYDFTRFTVLGHRYLFRDFALIEMGGLQGPEVVLSWSLRYLAWSIFRSRRAGRAVGTLFNVLLKPLSLLTSRASMYDAPSATYFLGAKQSGHRVRHKELVSLYQGQFT